MNTARKYEVSELRHNFHALDIEKRHQAIRELARKKSGDSSRELIQIYEDSQWRETKIFVIESLAGFGDQRSFEFLIELALDRKDIVLAENAVESLGGHCFGSCTLFLRELYESNHTQLRPVVVQALVHRADRFHLKKFCDDLKSAYENNQELYAKNLIYALGELKYFDAKDRLMQIVSECGQSNLGLTALVALGKVCREPEEIKKLKGFLSEDPFFLQIYESVIQQAFLRSACKIEDYLNKILVQKKYHPFAPMELNAFSDADLIAGIELFESDENTEQLYDLVSKLDVSKAEAIRRRFFSKKVNVENTGLGLFSEFNAELENYLLGGAFHELPVKEKISAVNQLTDIGLGFLPIEEKAKAVSRVLEELFFKFSEDILKARALRGLAQLKFESKKVNSYLKQNTCSQELLTSVVYYLARTKASIYEKYLLEFCQNELLLNKNRELFLRALVRTEIQVCRFPVIENYLLNLVKTGTTNEEEIKLLLRLISNSNWVGTKEFVIAQLANTSVSVQFNAVIAARYIKDDVIPDKLSPFLKSNIESVVGRALDSLLHLPQVRSKRLIFEFLENNFESQQVVEQICRRFETKGLQSDYFCKKIASLLEANPNHSCKSLLLDFKDRLELSWSENLNGGARQIPNQEAAQLDKILANKIKGYDQFDETIRSALRSAEIPFSYPTLFGNTVDKSSSILEYTKALDIVLERGFGRKLLMPKLELKLFEFQNVIHALEIHDPNVSAEKALRNLGLEKEFSPQSLPLHKISLVAQGILNSKILNEQFKVLDGLRAWAVVMLIFSRKTTRVVKPILPLGDSEDQVTALAKKLMWIQDLRNPIAHRQILNDFKTATEVQTQVIDCLNKINGFFKN